MLSTPISQDMLEDGRKERSAVWVVQIVGIGGSMLRIIHSQFIDDSL
jgi:hypothetical protein